MGMGFKNMVISVAPRFSPIITRGTSIISQRIVMENGVPKLAEMPLGRLSALPFDCRITDNLGRPVGAIETPGKSSILRCC